MVQTQSRRVPLVKSQAESSDAGSESKFGAHRLVPCLCHSRASKIERVEIAEPVERVEDLHFVPMEKRSGGWDVPGVPLRADALSV